MIALSFQEPKKYSVTLPLNSWIKHSSGLEYIHGALERSDLPAKEVKFIKDSIIGPLQIDIGSQVNAQIKADTTKPKKQ
jgi:hypothetical protein